MKHHKNLIVKLAFFALFLISCDGTTNEINSQIKQGDGTDGSIVNIVSNPKDDLLGDFTFEEGKKAEIRITKQNGNYFVSARKGASWEKPEQLDNMPDEDFIKMFGKDWATYVEAGLYKGDFGIFKIAKGSKYQKHVFDTGYFIFFLGGYNVYKIQ